TRIRMLIATATLIFSVNTAFAQAVQTGFVSVTPVTGTGAGLLVFGRATFRNDDALFESAVWSSSVLTSSSMVVSADASSGRDLGIAIVNPSNFVANITLTLRNQQGAIVATRTIVLNPLHQISRFISELFAVNVTGPLSINSSAPIALVGLQFRGGSFSVVPT